MTDGGAGAVAGMDDGGVWELEKFISERQHDVVVGAAPEIRAADTAGKERVAGEELGLAEGEIAAIVRKVERNAAGRVAGRVNDAGEEVAPLEDIAFLEQLVNFDEFRRAHAKERGLHFHAAIERKVVAMHHDRRGGVLIELGEAANVVDVGVGADDGFDSKLIAAEKAEDALDFVTRINDDGFQSARIADDGTVALEQANGELEIDHRRIGGVGQGMRWVRLVHGRSIAASNTTVTSCGARGLEIQDRKSGKVEQ